MRSDVAQRPNQIDQAQQFTFQGIRYQSPIPPPEILAGYNALVPDAADRILAMAERQSTHRISLERQYMAGSQARAWGGLVAGFVIGILGLLIVAYLGANHQPGLGGVVAALDIGSIVGTFVYGTKSQRRERQERQRAMGA